ncbi:MAG: adenylosuccinate lyase [Candidatus Doudnabacteria bacterium]|nr:adenylosuccinate lyase [Candidatus Doudnabacteria bacterium]
MNSLSAVSPIDGRYSKYTAPLQSVCSEAGLIRYRIIIEGEYFIALSNLGLLKVRRFKEDEEKNIRNQYNLSLEDAAIVRKIELEGYKNIKATDHDVKAVEYFLKDKLGNTSLKDSLEWIHFGLTSEDVDNLARGLMMSDALKSVIVPALSKILEKIGKFAQDYRQLPMLARTHGQPASPTTFGKEFMVFYSRLQRQLRQLQQQKILVKLSGSTGNFNAHIAAYPDVDWAGFVKNFVAHLNNFNKANLELNPITTQVEPNDSYAELFDNLRRINTTLISFDQDIWRYISDGWIKQKTVEGEIGSSTMPHKINPWKFENSEGNLGLANALFGFFSTKMPISRLQRDLSGSTVERNFGVALSHSLIGYSYLLIGLEKIEVNEQKIKDDLNSHPEVITEAIQTILRREGMPAPYEQLKNLARGKTLTLEDIHRFIDSLDVSDEIKKELKQFTPQNYTGLAERLADLE